MLQLTPDIPALIRWAEGAGVLSQGRLNDLGYALHAALRAVFDIMAPSPFALVQPPRRATHLLAYSPHAAPVLRDQAATFATPHAAAAIGLTTLADKPMPDRFVVGRRLGFTLRARPTIRTDKDGDRRRSQERDAFLAVIEPTAPNAGPTRGEVYQAWLTQRLTAGGAQPERLVLDAFQLTTTLRRNRDHQLRPILGPDATFSGVLVVTDPEAFATLLASGIGRHRAFGFGMLLLKPP